VRVERDEVELPLVEQLKAMGWRHVPGKDLDRDDHSEVLLTRPLAAALRRINAHGGVNWLDDERIAMAIGDLQRIQAGGLLEANQTATSYLLSGVSVPGDPALHGGTRTTVSFIDFNPDRVALNEFVVSDQVRVQRASGDFAVLDLVLFVNGIPLVVVECKSPDTFDAVGTAIRDLRAYAGVPLPPPTGFAPDTKDRLVGVQRLFHTVQLLVATSGEQAELGTITSGEEHFAPWRSVVPESESTIRAELEAAGLQSAVRARDCLTEQEMLAGVVLRPGRLLDIVRHFVLFMPTDPDDAGSRIVKVVCRHQQYRAVDLALQRLRTGSPPSADRPTDGRGGVVFHTQGSGKSLTMTFLVRAMRSDPLLCGFTVLVVTDRSQLQTQLSKTLKFSGDDVVTADTGAQIATLIGQRQARVIFAMIQKYGRNGTGISFRGDSVEIDPDTAADEGMTEVTDAGDQDVATPAPDTMVPLHSDSPQILVIVDEAHRSHTSQLHAYLSAAVPNAARIGFTGTPIVRQRKRTTVDIFGPYLDRYRLKESEQDGATVRILYEGRTGPARILGRYALDAEYDKMLQEASAAGESSGTSLWPTSTDVTESTPLIRAKAADMLRHYVMTALQGSFKAQVAVGTRYAAVAYRNALIAARDELLTQVEGFDPATVGSIPYAALSDEQRLLLTAHRFARLLRTMDFIPVVSDSGSKSADLANWVDPKTQQDHIDRFLAPLPQYPVGDPWSGSSDGVTPTPEAPRRASEPWSRAAGRPAPAALPPVAFLIVRSMLLTGFDAPIEQVLYLDRPIKEAELLQAIARVNRPSPGKTVGYVVDYAAVYSDLRKALNAYEEDDARDLEQNLVRDFVTEADELRAYHRDLASFLASHGVHELGTSDDLLAALLALADPADRIAFDDLLKEFTTRLENLLPRPEALDFTEDAKRFVLLQKRLRRRYRDGLRGDFDLRRYGRRVRALIAEHLELPEINQVIPPVSISTLGFLQQTEAIGDPHSVASEMASALRFHLEDRVRLTDPIGFARLSDLLEAILRDLDGRWEEQVEAIRPLLDEALSGQDPDLPDMTALEQAAYRILVKHLVTDALQPATLPDGVWFEGMRTVAISACDILTAEIGSVAYRGSDADLSDSARVLFDRLRRPWRALNDGPIDVEAFTRAMNRLASFGLDNADHFRARHAQNR
jgi:type I restriction enzyme, R subunit